MTTRRSTLTDTQKVAIIIAQMDSKRQHEVLAKFSESEVVTVMAEMAKLPVISDTLLHDVLTEVMREIGAFSRAKQGGAAVAEEILRERFGVARASELMERLQASAPIEAPLAFMNRIEPQQIHGVFATENPQAVAIVLAHIDAGLAATVLSRLDDDLRAEVTLRIARLGMIPTSVVERLGKVLENRLATFVRTGASNVAVNGVTAAVYILNNSDRASEKDILAKLEATDPEIAERIRSEMFGWDDVVNLDDRILQRVLREVTMPGLAKALKNKDPEVVDKFKRNLGQRQLEDLMEELDALGRIRLSDVEVEESVIVKTIRRLADEGEIDIARSDEEAFV